MMLSWPDKMAVFRRSLARTKYWFSTNMGEFGAEASRANPFFVTSRAKKSQTYKGTPK
jgi:hypothetical protein